MRNFTGTWGLYQWFEEHGEDLVHPDDLNAFRTLTPNGKVFECEAENDFLTLRYRDALYRVRPELFKPVEAPMYRFGQRVIVRDTGDEATVEEIHWHFQKGQPMFFIKKEGRQLKKRFWSNDLQPAQ